MAPFLKINTDAANAQASKNCSTRDGAMNISYGPRSYIYHVYHARHGGRAPPFQSADGVEECRPKDIAVPRATVFPPLSSPEEPMSSDVPELKIPKRPRSNALCEQSTRNTPIIRSDTIQTTSETADKTNESQAYPSGKRILQRSVAFSLPSENDTDGFPISSLPTALRNESNFSTYNISEARATDDSNVARTNIQKMDSDKPACKSQEAYNDKYNP